MEIRIFGTAEDSVVDGPGMRYSVFTQGCPHHCPGCHNPGSHAFEGGTLTDTAKLIAVMQRNPLISGLTLSGGDPMCQPEPCRILAEAAHALHKDVWCYTGYTWEELMQQQDEARLALLREVDVLVEGRFIQAQRSLELLYRGSKNQRMIDVPKTLQSGTIVQWEASAWCDL